MASANDRLILASASPVRARLLKAAAVDFRVEPAAVDEAAVKQAFRGAGHEASDCALALADAKARQVAARHPRALVIGADQILVCGGIWFDKPEDPGAVRAQLQALRGQTHLLATAVCAVRAGERLWQCQSAATLTMRQFSDAFLDDYLASEGKAVLGSVGAYRLEAQGAQLFDHINGDYFSILGLPLIELLGFLRTSGAIRG